VELAAEGKANSSNCRAEFAQFARKCRTKDFPVSLGPELETDQLNLFNMWLKHDKCMKSIELTITKRTSKTQRAAQDFNGFVNTAVVYYLC
jgi:hypothetical protein